MGADRRHPDDRAAGALDRLAQPSRGLAVVVTLDLQHRGRVHGAAEIDQCPQQIAFADDADERFAFEHGKRTDLAGPHQRRGVLDRRRRGRRRRRWRHDRIDARGFVDLAAKVAIAHDPNDAPGGDHRDVPITTAAEYLTHHRDGVVGSNRLDPHAHAIANYHRSLLSRSGRSIRPRSCRAREQANAGAPPTARVSMTSDQSKGRATPGKAPRASAPLDASQGWETAATFSLQRERFRARAPRSARRASERRAPALRSAARPGGRRCRGARRANPCAHAWRARRGRPRGAALHGAR